MFYLKEVSEQPVCRGSRETLCVSEPSFSLRQQETDFINNSDQTEHSKQVMHAGPSHESFGQVHTEEEVDEEERREIDLPLVEVILSSAQCGALAVENVGIFRCEHVCERVHIKVSVLCVSSVLVPSPR